MADNPRTKTEIMEDLKKKHDEVDGRSEDYNKKLEPLKLEVLIDIRDNLSMLVTAIYDIDNRR